MPRPLLRVASIYAPSPLNRQWHALQREFLRRNTTDADVRFGVFLNGVDAVELGGEVEIIGRDADNLGHAAALNRVLEAFRADAQRADGYLFLDSDCFPAHPQWRSGLTALMSRHGKRFAAPVRFENLEPYPHPCALYIDGPALDDARLRFDATAETANLLGLPVRDVGVSLMPLRDELLPLVRSNARNPHPVACALYNHLFYHHGAGSRHFGFRAIDRFGYYDHLSGEAGPAQADALMQALLADPEGFVNGLMRP